MRLDASGRLGIGTASPSSILDIQGNSALTIRIGNTGGVNGYQLKSNVSSSADFGFFIEDYSGIDLYKAQAGASGSHHFYINGSEKMRIDSSGNVGIGTSSPATELDIAKDIDAKLRITSTRNGAFVDDDNFGSLEFYGKDTSGLGEGIRAAIRAKAQGTFGVDTNLTFSTSNGSTGLDQERMRITDGGLVGIGTTSPTSTLEIAKNDQTNGATLSITNSFNGSGWTAGDTVGTINFRTDDTSTTEPIRGQIKVFDDLSGSTTYPAYNAMTFSTANATVLNERMRIDSSGNVGIGTSSPLSLSGRNLSIVSTGNIRLQLDSTNDYRIISNTTGNFAIQDFTNSSDKFTITGTGEFQFRNNSSEVMRLQSNGDLHVDGDVIAYSTTISDQRLKDDVQTIDNALDKVSNLRGVSYTWNNGNRKGQKDLGLIAQEVEQVLPELVREKEMPMIDGGTYKTVDYEKIVGVLIEAVKELKQEIEILKSK